MKGNGLLMLSLVAVAILVTPSTAIPADYTVGDMGESVHGEVRREIKKIKQNIINPPQALTQKAPEPEVAYKEVIETPPEVIADEPMKYDIPETKEGLTSNQLNDYPPEPEQGQKLDRQAGYPAGRIAPSAGYPFLYRGYPYIYGYPFDFRYGYAYGHAFGSDETFKCPSDGRYYRDFGSFYNCEDGHFTVQFCAPGSRNAPPARHVTPERASFCNVNMVGGNIPLLLPH